jgi:hypothetical protein
MGAEGYATSSEGAEGSEGAEDYGILDDGTEGAVGGVTVFFL